MSEVAAVVALLALAASVLALIGSFKILSRFTALGDLDHALRLRDWGELPQPQQTATYPLNLNVVNGIVSEL